MSQTCQRARHGCTGPRKCGFTVLQRGLAGGSNFSFLEELQATRLENSLKSGIYLFVFAHVDYVGFICFFFFSPLVVMSAFGFDLRIWFFFFPLHPFLSLFSFFVFFSRNIFPYLLSVLAMKLFFFTEEPIYMFWWKLWSSLCPVSMWPFTCASGRPPPVLPAFSVTAVWMLVWCGGAEVWRPGWYSTGRARRAVETWAVSLV